MILIAAVVPMISTPRATLAVASRPKAALARFGFDIMYVFLVRAQDPIGPSGQFEAAVIFTVIEDDPSYNIPLLVASR